MLQLLEQLLHATLGVFKAVAQPGVLVFNIRGRPVASEPIVSTAGLLFFVDFQPEQFIPDVFSFLLRSRQLFTSRLKGRLQFFNPFFQPSIGDPQLDNLTLILLMLRGGFLLRVFIRAPRDTSGLETSQDTTDHEGGNRCDAARRHAARLSAAVCLQTIIPMLVSCLLNYIVNYLIEKVDVAIMGASSVTRPQCRLVRLTGLSAGDTY
jgi:hypothetical protein